MKKSDDFNHILHSELLPDSSDFSFLDIQKNLYSAQATQMTTADISFLFIQFAAFSRSLPGLLTEAHGSLKGIKYTPLREEILLNLHEEMGIEGASAEYKGQSHYEILRNEIILLLGTDPIDENAHKNTQRFLYKIEKTLEAGGLRTYGALLALELTAVPELSIVKKTLEDWATVHKICLSSRLKYFFDSHVSDFEVQHAKRLFALSKQLLQSDLDIETCQKGFYEVISHMKEWWAWLQTEPSLKK